MKPVPQDLSGFVLYRQLQALSTNCVVATPSMLPHSPEDRRKTDKRDARSLAKALRNGMSTACHIPTLQDESIRDYQRMAADTKDALSSAKNDY